MKTNSQENITDELLTSYILNELPSSEKQRLDDWINSSDENKRHFNHLKAAWQQSGSAVKHSDIDEAQEWDAFKKTVVNNATENGRKKPLQNPTVLRIAAIFIAFMGAALVYLLLNRNSDESITFKSGQRILNDTLPDGSGITLNKNSVLSFTRATEMQREVKLEGEAFFNITKDEQHPFIIHAGDLTLKVLGTSFNVKSGGGKTEIIMETGAIQIVKGDERIQLLAKEKLIVYGSKPLPAKDTATDNLYNYYRTQTFNCNGTPLKQLVEALNNTYDQQITIANPQAGNYPITANFSKQPLSEILRIVCSTLQLTAVQKGNNIILQ